MEAGRRKTWKIPGCNFLPLDLGRDGGGWSIPPFQKASHSIGEPPTAQIMLLGVYTEPVNTIASGDYMATCNYMATHGVLLKLGKEKGSCTGSPFCLYF